MKKLFNLLIISLLPIACEPNEARVAQVKKDSLYTHRKLNENVLTEKAIPVSQEEPIPIANTDSIILFPPVKVENVFKLNYPTIKDVSWTKDIQLIDNKRNNEYKAFFLVNENKNWVIYTEYGEMLESRVQIMPEQLPPIIYKALKTTYPKVHVISATTFRHTKKDGTYTALIRPQTNAEEMEIILTENGTFVK